jgi:hypothetical protein
LLIYFQFCRHSWLASARIQELYESRELDLKMNEIAVLFHHLSDNYKQVSLKKSFVNHCNRTEYIFLYSTGNQSGLTTIIQGIHNITNEQLRGTYYFTTFYLDTIINCNFFSPFQQDKKNWRKPGKHPSPEIANVEKMVGWTAKILRSWHKYENSAKVNDLKTWKC